MLSQFSDLGFRRAFGALGCSVPRDAEQPEREADEIAIVEITNAARFVLMNLAGERTSGSSADAVRLEDRWILSRLERSVETIDGRIEAYDFAHAALERGLGSL